MGTFYGSRDLSNPNVFVFQLDETSPRWSGGSETGIKSSSFSFERPLLLLRYFNYIRMSIRDARGPLGIDLSGYKFMD